MWGLVDANHQAVFVDQTSGAIYRYSKLNVSNAGFNGNFISYTPISGTLPNTGTLALSSGKAQSGFVPQTSLTGYLAFSGGGLPVYSFDDTYQAAQYSLAASFATIAGVYSFSVGSNTASLRVTGGGSFTLSYTGCSGAGSLTIPNAAYNAYELSGTLTCSGSTQVITGLASFTPASGSTAAELTLEYDNGSSLAVQAVAKQ